MTTLRRAAVLVGCVTLLAASVARAQGAPPATSPPPAAAPPPAAQPAPPPGSAPASAPVTPLSPTMAPEPAGPPLVLSERTEQQQREPRPEPLYAKPWFWGALGVVFVAATIILFVNLRDNARQPPETTFGNMHAF